MTVQWQFDENRIKSYPQDQHVIQQSQSFVRTSFNALSVDSPERDATFN
jgi:hypothetical protein